MKLSKIVIWVLVSLALLGVLLTALWMRSPKKQPEVSKPAIQLVKEQHESELMAIKGVVGVAISQCQQEQCIRVYLVNESPSLREQIPTQLNGFKVDTKVTGNIEALPEP